MEVTLKTGLADPHVRAERNAEYQVYEVSKDIQSLLGDTASSSSRAIFPLPLLFLRKAGEKIHEHRHINRENHPIIKLTSETRKLQ